MNNITARHYPHLSPQEADQRMADFKAGGIFPTGAGRIIFSPQISIPIVAFDALAANRPDITDLVRVVRQESGPLGEHSMLVSFAVLSAPSDTESIGALKLTYTAPAKCEFSILFDLKNPQHLNCLKNISRAGRMIYNPFGKIELPNGLVVEFDFASQIDPILNLLNLPYHLHFKPGDGTRRPKKAGSK